MVEKKKKAQGKAVSAGGTTPNSRLPFEPAQTRQKAAKPEASGATKQTEATKVVATQSARSPKDRSPENISPKNTSADRIPAVVNQRMVSRAAAFCGIPTALALLTFMVSYVAIVNDVFKPPNIAVILVSFGFFGLGVLGLSYGPLSASWDEERLGNWLGWDEFTLNFGRLRESWRVAKAAQKETDTPPSD